MAGVAAAEVGVIEGAEDLFTGHVFYSIIGYMEHLLQTGYGYYAYGDGSVYCQACQRWVMEGTECSGYVDAPCHACYGGERDDKNDNRGSL